MGCRRVSTFVLFTRGMLVDALRRSAPRILSINALADQRGQAVLGLFVVVRY